MTARRALAVWYPRLALGIGSIVFAARMPGLADGDWGRLRTSALQHAWLPLLLLIASITVRGRSTLHTVSAVFGGFFTASFLGRVFGNLAIDTMGDNPWRLAAVVPIIEESAKVIPVLLVALLWRKSRGSPGIVDYGLIGVASGAGFGFHEDGLWQRTIGAGFDGPLGWLLPQLHRSNDVGVVVGHAVWTGIVGLAIGFVVTRRCRVAWVALATSLAMVVIDHGAWNNRELREDWRHLLLDGWLPVGVFFAGVVLAFIADFRTLRLIPRDVRILARDVPRYALDGHEGRPFTRFWFANYMVRISALTAHGARRRAAAGAGVSVAPEGVSA